MVICPVCGKKAIRFQRYKSKGYWYVRAVHYENGRVRFCHIPKLRLTSVIYGHNIRIAQAFKLILLHYVPPPAKVLDITCGFKMMYEELLKLNEKYNWYDFTFIDIRSECKPDVVADLRKLPIRIDAKFDAIVFDPPYPVHPLSKEARIDAYDYGRSKKKLFKYWIELTKAVNELAPMVKKYLIVKSMDFTIDGKLYSCIEECNKLLTNFELYDYIIYRFFKRSYYHQYGDRVPRKHSFFLIYKPLVM